MKIVLKNDVEIESDNDGNFKPLEHIVGAVDHACNYCPNLINEICLENAPFTCEKKGMFKGFHAEFENLIAILKEYNIKI